MPTENDKTSEHVARNQSEQLSFLRRSQIFLSELEMRSYPNATKLAQLCCCSRSTAMRTIDTLRKEFGAPIKYDESNRGYWITDPHYRLTPPPHTKTEIIALLMASKLAEGLGDPLLSGSLHSLVDKITIGRHDIVRIKRNLAKVLAIAPIHEKPVATSSIEALSLCLDGKPVRLTIPGTTDRAGRETLVGIPRQLIIKDFSTFLVIECGGGKMLTVPAQFVRSPCPTETMNEA